MKELSKSNRLVIRGKKDNVFQSCNEIHRVLSQFQKEEKLRRENEMLSLQVQWKYKDELDQFVPYDVEINARLEAAFQQGKTFLDLEITSEGAVRVDFIRMEETSRRGRLRVYRADKIKGDTITITVVVVIKNIIALIVTYVVFSFVC